MGSQEGDSSSTARRVKIDFEQPIRDKERLESKWNHRKSLAWDTAFFTNPGVLDPEELFGSLKIDENDIDVQVNHKHLPIPARPSFAWDNAFSTDPGVLDAEELSLVNNGFTIINTQLRKSSDSTTQGSRFSVASIESDLFHDLRASSLRNPPNVKQMVTVTRKIQRKLPDAKKMTKGYRQKDQPSMSLIPQPKVSSSLSSPSISKPSTPIQAKPVKKSVASELVRNSGKTKSHGFEEQSGSKSIIRSSYSGYGVKDLTSSSSGMRLPLPKMGFFNSENEEKENREPNAAAEANRRRRHKSKLETASSTPENRSVLGQRKTRK